MNDDSKKEYIAILNLLKTLKSASEDNDVFKIDSKMYENLEEYSKNNGLRTK